MNDKIWAYSLGLSSHCQQSTIDSRAEGWLYAYTVAQGSFRSAGSISGYE